MSDDTKYILAAVGGIVVALVTVYLIGLLWLIVGSRP